ncbi:Uncharacterised protein [Bordetella ansorpii]|uniref:Uncharacterized protein n=1 Tax=Bordetella ansorpii TaxID=288768 RepID=A0A157QLX5_9BORD|nr:hypothetical protein [Bordetella ansorpii]SAI46945.1 Uncharacterised protein [Bordetella ansorpii]
MPTQPNAMPLYMYRCPHCGSDDVGYEATSRFNPITQAWELNSEYDDAWCNECGDVSLHVYEMQGQALIDLREQVCAHQAAERMRDAAGDLFDALKRAVWFIEYASALTDAERMVRHAEVRQAWESALAKAVQS